MKKMKSLRIVLGCVCAMMLSASFAIGQSVTGSITGEVSDPSGAMVAGAAVTAHNLDTNVNTPTTTNAAGAYRIDNLPIGQYEVTVEARGFNRQTLPAFSLEALQTVTFNVRLAVLGSSSSVVVSSAYPILNTQDFTLSSTFTENTISKFPLNGLDFSALTLYVPGAASTYGNVGTGSFERSTYYSDSINMNGNRAQANNYTLEGIDMNETFNNLISYSPAPAALAEIQVLTANTPADFGNVNGASVVSVLKSGTNRFHGSAYGYVQDWRFNANSWQNKNVPPGTPVTPVNSFSQDQFGGTLGGPILHNKLFFFVDYLASRYHVGGQNTTSLLTAKMRAGDFSEILAVNSVQLYDPLNNNQPFPNNQGVPINNPVAQFLLAHQNLYPMPNLAPTDGVAANNYRGPQRTYRANNQGDAKIEYHINDRNQVTGFYAMSTGYDGVTPLLAISFSGPNVYPTKLGGGNWVHTFSPQLVNKATIGFTRTVWAQNTSVDSTGDFGLTGNSTVGIAFPAQFVPGYTYQSMGLFAGGNPVYGGGLIDNTYSYMDQVSWGHGKHYFSFGFSALRYQNNYPTANNYGYLGSLTYTGAFTKRSTDGNGGYGAADFLMDRVSQAAATLSSVNVGNRQWRSSFYFTDDYKLQPNVTIHYGFRYELDQPWYEQNDKNGNVDETTGQVLYASRVPVGAPPGSGLCKNRGCYNWSLHQFMPRLGFAWQVSNKFVVRGGYSASSFLEGNSSNQRLTSITPFIQAQQIILPAPTSTSVPTPLTTGNAFTDATLQAGGTYNVYPKNIQPAYIHNYNLTLEYALTNTLSLQTGYVGESGQHIEDYGNLNQWKVGGDPTSAPFYNSQYIGCNSNPSTAVCSNGLLVTESRAMMNYNGLQTVLRQRLSDKGLEYTVNYTWSKAMTNSLGNYALNVNGFSGAFQNFYDSGADYGVAGYDITHNITFTSTYALPFGHGRKFMSNPNRFLDEALGGWKVAAVGMFYTGFPETLTAGNSNVNSFGPTRANQLRPIHIRNRSVYQWFGDDPSAQFGNLLSGDPGQNCTLAGGNNGLCAFGTPLQNSFGTSSNGALRGPGYHDVDMSAFKDFRIAGEHYVGFRFDAFNAFNITSYGNPDMSLGNTFGHIAQENNIRSVERHLQFSAHYNF